MFTINQRIAVKPFETHEVKMTVKNGLARMEQRNSLTQLMVVFPTDCADANGRNIQVGDKIFVSGDVMKHSYSRDILELDGVKFVLIPFNVVVGIEALESDYIPF